jgi:hypothetical protein
VPRGMGQDGGNHQSLRLHQTEHGRYPWLSLLVNAG